MKTYKMRLHEALAHANGYPYAAITNDHLFNERHAYLTFDKHDQILTQIYYEEAKGIVHLDAHDYKFVDRTVNNLSTAFCPTINDLLEVKWWVFTLIKGDDQAQ